jgi:hypothetical protein
VLGKLTDWLEDNWVHSHWATRQIASALLVRLDKLAPAIAAAIRRRRTG